MRHGRELWASHPHVRSGADLSLGERSADRVRAAFGSWRFIWTQTVIVVCWIGLNVTGYVRHWDPYPFILLNLAFSTQAAYAAPVILLAQNRADRVSAEVQSGTHEAVTGLVKVNVTQSEILARLDGVRDDVAGLGEAVRALLAEPAAAKPKARSKM